jgi:hypothetical protein
MKRLSGSRIAARNGIGYGKSFGRLLMGAAAQTPAGQ